MTDIKDLSIDELRERHLGLLARYESMEEAAEKNQAKRIVSAGR
jgi:hypothetical protein